jgi:hypothetical protein
MRELGNIIMTKMAIPRAEARTAGSLNDIGVTVKARPTTLEGTSWAATRGCTEPRVWEIGKADETRGLMRELGNLVAAKMAIPRTVARAGSMDDGRLNVNMAMGIKKNRDRAGADRPVALKGTSWAATRGCTEPRVWEIGKADETRGLMRELGNLVAAKLAIPRTVARAVGIEKNHNRAGAERPVALKGTSRAATRGCTEPRVWEIGKADETRGLMRELGNLVAAKLAIPRTSEVRTAGTVMSNERKKESVCWRYRTGQVTIPTDELCDQNETSAHGLSRQPWKSPSWGPLTRWGFRKLVFSVRWSATTSRGN